MAIIQSTAIGNGKKSAGVLTYRRQRGRTIASQRILTNNSKTEKQVTQRSAFALASKAIAISAPIVDATFEKSKYGSARNNFFKMNKDILIPYFKELKEEVKNPYQLYEAFVAKKGYVTYGNGKLSVTVNGVNFTATGFGVDRKDVKLAMIALGDGGQVDISEFKTLEEWGETATVSPYNWGITVNTSNEGTNLSTLSVNLEKKEGGFPDSIVFPIFTTNDEICPLDGVGKTSN